MDTQRQGMVVLRDQGGWSNGGFGHGVFLPRAASGIVDVDNDLVYVIMATGNGQYASEQRPPEGYTDEELIDSATGHPVAPRLGRRTVGIFVPSK